MGAVDDLYADGTFVAEYNGFSFNDLLANDWSAPFGNLFDLSMKLDYQAVPEPSIAGLLGLTLAILALRRWTQSPCGTSARF